MTFPGMVKEIVERQDISETAKRKIFDDNPQRFCKLNGA